MTDRRCISRRDFLAAGAATTASFSLSSSLFAAPKGKDREDAPEKIDWKGFKMGIQSYSMRGFKLDKAIEECKKLQLYYWESFKDHLPVTTVPGEVAKQKELLDTNGIKLLAYGVLDFKEDETKAREYFDYAKAVGIETLSANPEKNEATFKLLDKLVEEYQINIAIHNHGPKARYDKIDEVVNAVKDHHPRIGACVDTGHYLRSSESPVEAIERLKGRVYGCHLKDVKDTKVFKILGEGDLDVLGCLKALKAQDYQHVLALEYEEHPENPVPDLEICLTNLRGALAKL